MEKFLAIHLPLLVWLGACGLFWLFLLMYDWAKKQKGVAMALGILIQMFLPDPKAQQTIEFIVESKKSEQEEAASSAARKGY